MVTLRETTQETQGLRRVHVHTRGAYTHTCWLNHLLAAECATLTPRSNARAQALGGGSGAEGVRAEDVEEDAPLHLLGEARRHQGRYRASHGVSHQREPVPAQGPCLEKQTHNKNEGRLFGLKKLRRRGVGANGQVQRVEDACSFFCRLSHC